ncbi:MAG TPA: hypothetical protein VFA22_07935, partial [Stellaceae bacterium]|nr:hypothetical protein [Stellaceae bacterium]
MTPIRLVVACFGLLAAAAAARAAEISVAPVLRIETGMHGAAINGIAADEADHQLVTVSDDKTARVWSATDGTLLTTIRAPVGPGAEGGLYAATLSPSGKTIVVGGYTGIDWDGSASIYLYSRVDGAWLGRIALGPGTDAVNRLAFSPNGRFIAVATNDRRGLRIIDTGGQKLSIVDSDYGDAIEWVDFAADGRLVASALDGEVRLYDAAFKKLATWHAPKGEKPYAAVFDRSGGSVAVGLLGGGGVVVLDGHSLKQKAAFRGAAGKPGALSVVAWSADGGTLYAAGTYGDPSGRKRVRAWP